MGQWSLKWAHGSVELERAGEIERGSWVRGAGRGLIGQWSLKGQGSLKGAHGSGALEGLMGQWSLKGAHG